MPDRALASAFGGIADFLKLQRGYQHETADRKLKEEAHRAALKASDVAVRSGEEDILGKSSARLYEPRRRGLAEATQFYTIGGAKAAEASLNSPTSAFSGDPNLAGLNAALRQRDEAERVEQQTGVARRDLTQGQVAVQGSKLTALKKIDERKAAGTFDPRNNPEDHDLAVAAELPGLTTPTYKMTTEEKALDRTHAVEMQERGISASYGLQAAAQKYQREQYLPDSTPALDAEIERQIRPIEQSANQALAENNAIQGRITSAQLKKQQNTILLDSGQGTPQMRAEQATLDAEIKRATDEWNAKVADFEAKKTAVVTMFKDSLRAHPTVLSRVETRLGSALAGVVKKEGAPAAVADPNKKGF